MADVDRPGYITGFRAKLVAHISANQPDALGRCAICGEEITDDTWKSFLREPYPGTKLGLEHYLQAHLGCHGKWPAGASVLYVQGKTTQLHTRPKKPDDKPTDIRPADIKPTDFDQPWHYQNYLEKHGR